MPLNDIEYMDGDSFGVKIIFKDSIVIVDTPDFDRISSILNNGDCDLAYFVSSIGPKNNGFNKLHVLTMLTSILMNILFIIALIKN